MEKITSKDNAKIKKLKKLQLAKYREEFRLFVVENYKTITDAAASGYMPKELYGTEEFFSDYRETFGIEACVVDEKTFASFSSLETPSGVAAVFEKKVASEVVGEHVLYLNGIADPGNLGTIIRSALAFGVKDIVVDEKCADVFSPKTVSAAKDAIFKVRILEDNKKHIFNSLHKNRTIISAALHTSGKAPHAIFKPQTRYCLVVGNEGRGIDADILDASHEYCTIPMSGEIESLNAATAASILLYELSQS